MKNWFRRILGLTPPSFVKEDVMPQQDVECSSIPDEELEAQRLNNLYGVDLEGNPAPCFFPILVGMDKIGWNIYSDTKAHILTNVSDYQEKVSIWGFISSWRGMGKAEWEFQLAFWLVYELRKAWKEGREEIDITFLFNRDMLAAGGRMCPRAQVVEYISKVFTVVSETDSEVRLTLNVD